MSCLTADTNICKIIPKEWTDRAELSAPHTAPDGTIVPVGPELLTALCDLVEALKAPNGERKKDGSTDDHQ